MSSSDENAYSWSPRWNPAHLAHVPITHSSVEKQPQNPADVAAGKMYLWKPNEILQYLGNVENTLHFSKTNPDNIDAGRVALYASGCDGREDHDVP